MHIFFDALRQGEIRYDSDGWCWDIGTEGYTLVVAFLSMVRDGQPLPSFLFATIAQVLNKLSEGD